MSRKHSKLSRRVIEKRGRARKKLHAELKELEATGVPSEWLLQECLKKHRHQLRARVGLSGMLDGSLGMLTLSKDTYTNLVRKAWEL
jgi:hypothetical protein